MATRSRSPIPFILAAVAVTAVLATAVVFATRRDSNEARPVTGDGWVIVDGWSWQMRGDRAVEVLVDEGVVGVEFAPITPDDLDALLDVAPNAVQNLAARVATNDPSLRCTADGCATADGPLDLSEIAAPTSPTLAAAGVEHGAWVARPNLDDALSVEARLEGTTSGALVVLRPDVVTDNNGSDDAEGTISLEVPASSVPADLGLVEDIATDRGLPALPYDGTGELPDEVADSADRLAQIDSGADPAAPTPDPTEMDLSQVPSTVPAPETVDGGEPAPTEPGPAVPNTPGELDSDSTVDAPGVTPEEFEGTGSGETPAVPPVLTAGVAWGVMFPLATPWFAEDDEGPSATALGAARVDVAAVETLPVAQDAPFRDGLAVDDPAADALTPSQLTAWSSPLIGCGLGVVCAPTTDGTDVADDSEPFATRLCLAAGPLGGAPTPVNVVLRDSTMSFTTARVQLGAWPADAETPPNSYWPVPAPTAEDTSVRSRVAEVYDADGLLTVIGSQALTADGGWDVDTLLATGAGAFLERCDAP